MAFVSLRSRGARPHRFASRLAAGAAACTALFAVGCLPPTNPCDPDAPTDLQARVDLGGQVVDQTGAPVSEVTVAVDQTGQTATTNAEGEFQLTDLPPSSSYSLSAYPESPGVGGTITVDNLGCNEARGELQLPIVIPPDSPEVEITAATAPDRLLVAFPSVIPDDPSTDGHEAAQSPMDIVRLGQADPCAAELETGAPQHRYWLEVRAPFDVWQRALINPDPIASKGALGGFPLDDAYESLGEACLRATCGYYTHAFNTLAEKENARCTEIVGFVDALGGRQPLSPFATYQVRVRTDELVPDAAAETGSLPSAVTSMPSAAPDRLSLTPTATLPVPLASNIEDSEAQAADLDVSSIVPVADGRFALVSQGGLMVVGAGSLDAQLRNNVGPGIATQSDNSASVADGMFLDDVTSEATLAETTADNAIAVDVLPAGKWVRVLKRQGDGSTMIDKVWVGDSWGTAPMNNNPTQPVFSMDVTAQGLGDQFLGFRWLGAIEGDPTDPEAPYNPPDAYLLLFEDGVAMFEAADDDTVESDNTYMDEAMGDADNGENPSWYDADPVNPPLPNTTSMCDAMGGAVGNYTESGAGLNAFGACFDMTRVLDNVRLTDVNVLETSPGAFETAETLHLFADAAGDRVVSVLSDHLLAKNLPDPDPEDPTGIVRLPQVTQPIPVGIEPVALQPSVMLTCDGLEELDRQPVMLVANRGSLDISVIAPDDLCADGACDGLEDRDLPNPRYEAFELEVIGLPMAPTGFFDDLGGPTCAGPYSWVVGDGGEMMPIDMRTLSLPPCNDGPCQVATRSRARAGAISRNIDGKARVLIGGQGLLSEVGYLLPSPSSSFYEEAVRWPPPELLEPEGDGGETVGGAEGPSD